jgi:hypothetical protein
VHFGLSAENMPWDDIKNKDYACIDPVRDIVATPVSFTKDHLRHGLRET